MVKLVADYKTKRIHITCTEDDGVDEWLGIDEMEKAGIYADEMASHFNTEVRKLEIHKPVEKQEEKDEAPVEEKPKPEFTGNYRVVVDYKRDRVHVTQEGNDGLDEWHKVSELEQIKEKLNEAVQDTTIKVIIREINKPAEVKVEEVKVEGPKFNKLGFLHERGYGRFVTENLEYLAEDLGIPVSAITLEPGFDEDYLLCTDVVEELSVCIHTDKELDMEAVDAIIESLEEDNKLLIPEGFIPTRFLVKEK